MYLLCGITIILVGMLLLIWEGKKIFNIILFSFGVLLTLFAIIKIIFTTLIN